MNFKGSEIMKTQKQQYEQIKLYEQFRIIYNEVKSLSEESQTIVKNALGEICDIEMAWGILFSIEVAKYNNKINKEEALELIQWWEDNSSPVYIKEMKKDLKFIEEGENK
jgi:hypothetical protein